MTDPPLQRFYQQSYIAGHLPNAQENLIKWIQDPQQMEPGKAMPALGMSKDEAEEIAAYLYRRPAPMDWTSRWRGHSQSKELEHDQWDTDRGPGRVDG